MVCITVYRLTSRKRGQRQPHTWCLRRIGQCSTPTCFLCPCFQTSFWTPRCGCCPGLYRYDLEAEFGSDVQTALPQCRRRKMHRFRPLFSTSFRKDKSMWMLCRIDLAELFACLLSLVFDLFSPLAPCVQSLRDLRTYFVIDLAIIHGIGGSYANFELRTSLKVVMVHIYASRTVQLSCDAPQMILLPL